MTRFSRALSRPLGFPLLLLAGLAACGAPPPENAAEPETGAEAPIEQTAEPAAESALTAVPQRFRGRWNASAEACAAGAGEMGLEVAGDTLRFHESVGRVQSVRQVAPNAVEAELAFEGEGQSWRETRTLRLLQDGRLSVEGRGSAATRVRCRAASAAPASGWQSAASGEGDALFLAAGADRRALTLFCPAGSNDLLVNVPAFRPVASEERMTFGAGGTVVTLVADFAGDRQRGGVSGTGPVPSELEAILTGGTPIGVNYGAQNSGPHAPPPAELAKAFVQGCRD
ncbi:MAG: hypothetical protein ACK40O_02670 [Allosphingosinicella sp.]